MCCCNGSPEISRQSRYVLAAEQQPQSQYRVDASKLGESPHVMDAMWQRAINRYSRLVVGAFSLVDASTHLGPAARLASGSRAGRACCSLTGFTADPRLLVRPLNHGKQGVKVAK